MAAQSQHIYFDATQDIYNVFFGSECIVTTVTKDHLVATSWILDTLSLHAVIVGLHIEWYRPVHNQYNPALVDVLQLCVGHRCLIFQIGHSPIIPYSLINLLKNPTITFVGVRIESYRYRLYCDYGLRIPNCVNLSDLAAYCLERDELSSYGLKRLAWVVLGRRVSKPPGIIWSQWNSERLSPAQVAYASVDAFVSFQMGWYLFSRYF